MGFLTNSWVRYISRSYQQIKADVLTYNAANVPEITDHTESNIFVKIISIFAGIAEMLGYYTDNAAREAFIDSCRLYKSAFHIAKSLSYRIRGASAASVTLTFTLNAPAPSAFNIPSGTRVKTSSGIEFATVTALSFAIGDTVQSVGAINTYAVTGKSLATSVVNTTDYVVLCTDKIVDGSLVPFVNSTAWTVQDTLAFSAYNATDCVFGVQTELGQVGILFGNDTYGKSIPNGAITANYSKTDGLLGNVPANSITAILSTLTLPMGVSVSVNNNTAAVGGTDFEDLTALKQNIPVWMRLRDRCNTLQDYEDEAKRYAGVANATAKGTCGSPVKVYVLPIGGGVAPSPMLTAIQNILNDKSGFDDTVQALAAGEVRLRMNIDVVALPNALNAQVGTDVMTTLTTWLSWQNQDIGGLVAISDLYQKMDDTTGVKRTSINSIIPLPYATPLSSTTNPLAWTYTVATNNTNTDIWTISIINSTNFQLFKNNIYVGTYSLSVAVVLPEITFTVSPNGYIIGDLFTFVTYPDTVNVLQIAEPSIAAAYSSDITLNVTGGI